MPHKDLNSKGFQSQDYYVSLGRKNSNVVSKDAWESFLPPDVFPFVFLLAFKLVTVATVWNLNWADHDCVAVLILMLVCLWGGKG